MTETKDKTTTTYVILHRVNGESGWDDTLPGGGLIVTAEGVGAASAIKAALKDNDDLATLAQQGEGIEVLAIPARSYNPTPVRLVPREPVIKVG